MLRGGVSGVLAVATATISLWFKPNWSSGDGNAHVLYGYFTSDGSTFVIFRKHADNNLYMGWEGSVSTPLVQADTGLFEAGVWAHHALVWDDTANANFQAYYRNGVFVTSNTAAFAGSIITQLTIGNYPFGYGGSAADNLDGTVAEYAVWNRVLTDDELLEQAEGFSPLFRPRGLVTYLPLRGVDGAYTTELNRSGDTQLALTPTSTTNADHPRILMPVPPFAFGFSGDPGPGGGGGDALYPSWQSAIVVR